MYLMVDNYDSFVYNLACYLEECGERVELVRNCGKAGWKSPHSGDMSGAPDYRSRIRGRSGERGKAHAWKSQHD